MIEKIIKGGELAVGDDVLVFNIYGPKYRGKVIGFSKSGVIVSEPHPLFAPTHHLEQRDNVEKLTT